jgi:hypothetical protein
VVLNPDCNTYRELRTSTLAAGLVITENGRKPSFPVIGITGILPAALVFRFLLIYKEKREAAFLKVWYYTVNQESIWTG